MDWEQAFERCPPYGEGAGAYGPEDVKILAEMERSMECLLHWLETEGVYHLDQYLTAYRQYVRRQCRYYYYRGMLHGTREALDAWQEEYGAPQGGGLPPPPCRLMPGKYRQMRAGGPRAARFPCGKGARAGV